MLTSNGHLVALAVIQAEECDQSGVVFSDIISRLVADAAGTLLLQVGWSVEDITQIAPYVKSCSVEIQEEIVANQSIATYCQIGDIQSKQVDLSFGLHNWVTNQPVAEGRLQLFCKELPDPKKWFAMGASITRSLAKRASNPPAMLLKHFSARHRGQAGHVNIAHFAQSVSDACRNVLSVLGVDASENVLLYREKIRFVTEIHPGDSAFIRCDIDKKDPGRWSLSGEMVRVSDNKVVCQFQREIEASIGDLAVESAKNKYFAEPLNMSLRDVPGGDVVWGPVESYRGTVEPMEVDVFSNLSARALWDKMTRGLWSVQNALGANRDVMIKHGIAGGAAMFQLQFHCAAKLGTPIVIQSSMRGRSESSLRMQHVVTDARDSSILIEASYVLTFFNRETGGRIPIPSFVMALIEK